MSYAAQKYSIGTRQLNIFKKDSPYILISASYKIGHFRQSQYIFLQSEEERISYEILSTSRCTNRMPFKLESNKKGGIYKENQVTYIYIAQKQSKVLRQLDPSKK